MKVTRKRLYFCRLFFAAAANIVRKKGEEVMAIIMVMTDVARIAVINSDKRLAMIKVIVEVRVIAAMMEATITVASGIGTRHLLSHLSIVFSISYF